MDRMNFFVLFVCWFVLGSKVKWDVCPLKV